MDNIALSLEILIEFTMFVILFKSVFKIWYNHENTNNTQIPRRQK
jgi:hypothetical protein